MSVTEDPTAEGSENLIGRRSLNISMLSELDRRGHSVVVHRGIRVFSQWECRRTVRTVRGFNSRNTVHRSLSCLWYDSHQSGGPYSAARRESHCFYSRVSNNSRSFQPWTQTSPTYTWLNRLFIDQRVFKRMKQLGARWYESFGP